MNILYTTSINALYTVASPTGYVTKVEFTVYGNNGTNTAFINGDCLFEINQDQTIIPLEQLTENEVIKWVNEATSNQTFYYDNISNQLAAIKNPPEISVNTPLPWVKK